jgi:DNA-binding response OmpR family regulator
MVSSKRVLIVEDEFFVALDLELLVHKHSPAAQVVVCASVAEARKATSEPVGLALLDIDVLDGKTFEIAHSLKQQNIPVVFVSGSKPEEIPQDLADVPFIPKPFAAPVVQAAIGAILTPRTPS